VLEDRIITRLGEYEIEALKWYPAENPNEFSLHLIFGNGQSSVTIHAHKEAHIQRDLEAQEFMKGFWDQLLNRAKDFEMGIELPPLWEPDLEEPQAVKNDN